MDRLNHAGLITKSRSDPDFASPGTEPVQTNGRGESDVFPVAAWLIRSRSRRSCRYRMSMFRTVAVQTPSGAREAPRPFDCGFPP
jgi:hypothetical protein